MEAIRKYFDQLVPMSDSEWKLFSSKLKRRELKKKENVLDITQIEENLAFVERGMLRYFVPKEEGDITFGFCFEGEFSTAYDSFVSRSPSKYKIETLTPTIIWYITYKDLQHIYKKTQVGQEIGRLIAETLLVRKTDRELSLLLETASARYLNLFTERPQIIKEIPLKYIASYIGVTPQSLSRIRKEIS